MFELGDERYHQLLEGKFSKGLGIQVFRRLLGVKQEDLAAQLGVSAAAISSWENGRVSCSPERIQQISQALGILPARLVNPAVAEVEEASHTTLYDGHKFKRMVLRVPQVTQVVKQEKAPEVEIQKPIRRSTPDYVDHIVRLGDRTYQVRHLDRLPTYDERRMDVCWVFGPNNIVRTEPGRTYLRLTREPTRVEVVQLSFGGWLYLGYAIRSYMELRRISNKSLARSLGCNLTFIGELMNASGLNNDWVNEYWGTLDLMTDIMHLDAGTFHMFTQRGRDFVLSKVLEGIES